MPDHDGDIAITFRPLPCFDDDGLPVPVGVRLRHLLDRAGKLKFRCVRVEDVAGEPPQPSVEEEQ